MEVEGKTIGTHSGTFHCDDAMGCMLLQNFTQEFKGGKIVRSRDTAVLDTLDIIIDVGDVYDPEKNRFDHHQRGFGENFSDKFKIKLSASGLVYKHYGKEILQNAVEHLFSVNLLPENLKPLITEEEIEKMWGSLYKYFFCTLDAIDNGISRYDKSAKPRYHEYRTDLASRVKRLNPSWWDDENITHDERFNDAMKLCKEEFLQQLRIEIMSGLASIPIVKEAIDNGNLIEENQILVLDKNCFWKEALFKIEQEKDIQGACKYVLYKDTAGNWRVQAVPAKLDTFESRLPLKEEWRGKRDEDLQEVSGVSDAIFCHHSGFIGGAASKDGVMKMARLSLGLD